LSKETDRTFPHSPLFTLNQFLTKLRIHDRCVVFILLSYVV